MSLMQKIAHKKRINVACKNVEYGSNQDKKTTVWIVFSGGMEEKAGDRVFE